MLKSQIRKQILQARQDLGAKEFAFFSFKIFEQFKRIDLSAIHTMHLFLPIQEKREVNTWLIVKWLQEENSHIRLVVPRFMGSFTELAHIELLADVAILLNKWGIPEPVSGELITPSEIDLCLVPLLGIDRRGYRLGYGGGFYDRFLATCRPDIRTIGLSLFEPLAELIEIDKFDIPLQTCIFPWGINYYPESGR